MQVILIAAPIPSSDAANRRFTGSESYCPVLGNPGRVGLSGVWYYPTGRDAASLSLARLRSAQHLIPGEGKASAGDAPTEPLLVVGATHSYPKRDYGHL